MSEPPVPEDFTNDEFAWILDGLEPYLPISNAYRDDPDGIKFVSERDHMTGWFASQSTLGSGEYTRRKPNYSARTTYNRLLNPASLLWIAEALGEDPVIVQRAADAARGEPDHRRKVGLVRKHLPWARIAELAQARATRPSVGERIRRRFRR